MSGGQGILIVDFAVGSAVMVVRRPIPTRVSRFHIDGFGVRRNLRRTYGVSGLEPVVEGVEDAGAVDR